MTASAATVVTPVAERQGIVTWAAAHFGVDAGKVLPILKSTCFKGEAGKEPSDAEVAALLIVAREHKLNPFLKEIFAFPAKGGGIVPVVGVDGWTRIVNGHPQFTGVEFIYAAGPIPEWIECHIFRDDRKHPIKVRELMAECRRETSPWKSHPSRMLRHKAFIQCARLAFGFAGIFDEDEADRIITAVDSPAPAAQPTRGAAALKAALTVGDPAGGGNAADIIDGGNDNDTPAAEKPTGTLEQRDGVVASLNLCADLDILDLTMDSARTLTWSPADQAVIDEAYKKRAVELKGA